MANTTAVMLVLMLTGTPAAGVVCLADCGTPPAAAGHCHEDTIDGTTMSLPVSCYDPSVAESVYVAESRAVVGPAMLVVTPLPAMMPIARVEAIGILPPSADALLKPPLVLRI